MDIMKITPSLWKCSVYVQNIIRIGTVSLIASNAGTPQAEKCISDLRELFQADVFEEVMGKMLRDYVAEHLNPYPDLYSEVFQALQDRKIISKSNFRLLMKA